MIRFNQIQRKKLLSEINSPILDDEFNSSMNQFGLECVNNNLAMAISGGSDSMALSVLLSRWSKNHSINLYALIIDHCLREESRDEAFTVSKRLQDLKINNQILRWEKGKQFKKISKSYQDDARQARLKLMSEWCKSNNINTLFMGHHADDQLETFFYRLIRGSGVEGLSGMSSDINLHSLRIIRPLLNFPKSRLVETCKLYNLSWVEDPSNNDKKYLRVKIRKILNEFESEGFNTFRLHNTINHINRAKLAIDKSVFDAMDEIVSYDEDKVLKLNLEKFLIYPEEIILRTLSNILIKVSGKNYSPRFNSLERLYEKIIDPKWSDRTLHGCKIIIQGKYLIITKENY